MFEDFAEVAFNKPVAAGTWLMGIQAAPVARSAMPGQFVMLRVRDGVDPLLRRPFSICGVRGDLVLILYRVVGKGTGLMAAEIREGSRVAVLGPLGRAFHIPVGRAPSVLVAGGIGIAPLLFLASALPPGRYRFLAGFGSKKEIIPLEEPLLHPVTAEIATDDGSAGRRGLVTDLLDEPPGQTGLLTPTLFACGPKAMLRAVASYAVKIGAECKVSLEALMACGLGACQGCAVKSAPGQGSMYYHVCRDGPVFDANVIGWEDM